MMRELVLADGPDGTRTVTSQLTSDPHITGEGC